MAGTRAAIRGLVLAHAGPSFDDRLRERSKVKAAEFRATEAEGWKRIKAAKENGLQKSTSHWRTHSEECAALFNAPEVDDLQKWIEERSRKDAIAKQAQFREDYRVREAGLEEIRESGRAKSLADWSVFRAELEAAASNRSAAAQQVARQQAARRREFRASSMAALRSVQDAREKGEMRATQSWKAFREESDELPFEERVALKAAEKEEAFRRAGRKRAVQVRAIQARGQARAREEWEALRKDIREADDGPSFEERAEEKMLKKKEEFEAAAALQAQKVKEARTKGVARAEESWKAFKAELEELGEAPDAAATAKLKKEETERKFAEQERSCEERLAKFRGSLSKRPLLMSETGYLATKAWRVERSSCRYKGQQQAPLPGQLARAIIDNEDAHIPSTRVDWAEKQRRTKEANVAKSWKRRP